MPIIRRNPINIKSGKAKPVEYKEFKGLNLFKRTTELKPNELSTSTNTILVGSGTPTVRWGSSTYFEANATGSVRGFGTFKTSSVNELLALTDQGYLVKKNGTSSTQINGNSWPSGSVIRTEQLGGETYIVSEDVSFTKYDGTSLSIFATISAPTGLSATNFSGASGPNSISYIVSAVDPNGNSTEGSTNYVLDELPNDLSATQVHLFWSAPSAASISSYEIYRGRQGSETFLVGVGVDTTKYIDNGADASQTILAPTINNTGGIKSPIIKKYKDRLVMVDATDPNKLIITGRYPNHTKTSWLDGGGFVYIDPDSGDDIVGVEVQPIADRIVVYKQFASFLVDPQLVQIGNFFVLDPQYQPISTSVGCSSQGTIATVENDTFYFGRDGIHVTGYEPDFLNIIRTNEVSARIRPYFDTLSATDFSEANAFYVDNKYILFFPDKKEAVVYDRERGAFAGIWRLPFGITHARRYFDGTNENWVFGTKESNQVYSFQSSLQNDNGSEIVATVRTGKQSFGDATTVDVLSFFHFLFRNIKGTVRVNIIREDRNSNTTNAKTFTINGASTLGSTGWGIDKWGYVKWGQTDGTYSSSGGDEISKHGRLWKQSRLTQIEIVTSGVGSNFEWLYAKLEANTQKTLSINQRV